MATPPSLAACTEEERAATLIRFAIIQPFFEDGVPRARLAHTYHLQPRKVQRWTQFHLLKNLGDQIDRVLQLYHAAIEHQWGQVTTGDMLPCHGVRLL